MCEYCSDAFTDVMKEDNFPKMLSTNKKHNMFSGVVHFSLFINEHGHLAVSADTDDGSETFLNKKIRFCPMCGAKIPAITPTDR